MKETTAQRELLALAAAGPVVFVVHFGVVYFGAESVCYAGGWDATIAGMPSLSFAIGAATLVALVALAWPAACARSIAVDPARTEDERFLARLAIALAAFFALAVAFAGAPALALDPC